MIRSIIIALLLAAGLYTPVCGEEIDSRFPQAREFLRTSGMTITTSADQAYGQKAILVMGEGVPKKGAVGGQKRLTALTAAKVVAQRRLAEILEGVTIVSSTTIRDSQRQSETIKTTVTGFVRGAQPVVQDWNAEEETALVVLQVGITGARSVAAVMYEKILADSTVARELDTTPYSGAAARPAAAFDGLIIDATGFNFRPALINRIFAENGDVLYDPAKISQKVLVEQGCGEYSNSVDKAKAALGRRGVKAPLIVKAAGVPTPSDLRVSSAVAADIFSANQGSGFMADARVAFVLK
ncbi:MAG: hypothetical protein WCP10_08855 [Desulfuromonadales bacterium]